ncbi:MAG: hypothetical protein DRI30_08090, partial [Chloroflexi bacterium]
NNAVVGSQEIPDLCGDTDYTFTVTISPARADLSFNSKAQCSCDTGYIPPAPDGPLWYKKASCTEETSYWEDSLCTWQYKGRINEEDAFENLFEGEYIFMTKYRGQWYTQTKTVRDNQPNDMEFDIDLAPNCP